MDGVWRPGEGGREGPQPLPESGTEFAYFNDVTGQRGKTPEEAAESLKDLAYRQGSLANMALPTAVAGQTVDGASPLMKLDVMLSRMLADEHHAGDPHIALLGYFSFSAENEDWQWNQGDDTHAPGDWTPAIGSFLKSFMTANGQMDYIRSRPWYRDRTHKVEIDVNYFINRPFGERPDSFHKDTGGANLFVNLVFTNKAPTLGTEVTVDTNPMNKDKQGSLKLHMSEAQIAEIEDARGALAGTELARKIVSTELPAWGHVSWVDELIWHASPYIGNRQRWSLGLATQALTPPFDDKTRTHEAMILVARDAESWISRRMRQEEGEDTLSFDLAMQYLQRYHRGGELKDDVERDIQRIRWGEYKIGEASGHEQDGDDPRVESRKTIIVPSGLVGRPRSLSDASEQKRWAMRDPAAVTDDEHGYSADTSTQPAVTPKPDLKEKEEKQEKESEVEETRPKAVSPSGRNFLRTWVRLKRI